MRVVQGRGLCYALHKYLGPNVYEGLRYISIGRLYKISKKIWLKILKDLKVLNNAKEALKSRISGFNWSFSRVTRNICVADHEEYFSKITFLSQWIEMMRSGHQVSQRYPCTTLDNDNIPDEPCHVGHVSVPNNYIEPNNRWTVVVSLWKFLHQNRPHSTILGSIIYKSLIVIIL